MSELAKFKFYTGHISMQKLVGISKHMTSVKFSHMIPTPSKKWVSKPFLQVLLLQLESVTS